MAHFGRKKRKADFVHFEGFPLNHWKGLSKSYRTVISVLKVDIRNTSYRLSKVKSSYHDMAYFGEKTQGL